MRAGKGLVRTGRRKHAAHEPLNSLVIVAEVPLVGADNDEIDGEKASQRPRNEPRNRSINRTLHLHSRAE